jgi:hypothetical protein
MTLGTLVTLRTLMALGTLVSLLAMTANKTVRTLVSLIALVALGTMTANETVRTLVSLITLVTLMALATLGTLQSFVALDYAYACAAGADAVIRTAADNYLKPFGITVRSAPAMFYCDIKRVLGLGHGAGARQGD